MDDNFDIAGICQRVAMVRQSCYGQRGKASFARDLGISPSTYDYYENKRVPPADILLKVSQLTQVDVRWLLTGEKKFADANVSLHPIAKRLNDVLESGENFTDIAAAFVDAIEKFSSSQASGEIYDSNKAFSDNGGSDFGRVYTEIDLPLSKFDSGGGQAVLGVGQQGSMADQSGSISGSLVAGFVPLNSDKGQQNSDVAGSADGASASMAAGKNASDASFHPGSDGEHQGWIPVLGRSAAGVPQFWANVDSSEQSEPDSVTMLEDLVAAMKPRKARYARKAMAQGELASESGAQIVLLDAPESPGTAEFIIAEHIADKYSDLFALRIDGESMEPEICHGDVVVMSPSCPAEPGSAAVVQLDGQIGVTCKLIRYDGDRVHLIPVNESFAPSVHEANSVRWALKVIACVRSV